jgi:hypothetical protein
MIRILLYLLDKIPYRTRFGLSLADELKVIYYHKFGKHNKRSQCLCGGTTITRGIYPDGWETICHSCDFLYDED